MSINPIILKIGGEKFEGWISASIQKSLYNMTGTFTLSTTDISGWGTKIIIGSPCSIEIYGQTVIDGYVEEIPIDYNDTSHSIQIRGRDKTCDLVDCSYIGSTNEWIGQPLSSVIQSLCSPFDISIAIDHSVLEQVSTKITSVKANEFDTIFDIISSLCKVHAILLISYGDGKLTLTRAGSAKAHDTLELGSNVKSGTLTQSNIDRFQTYAVKGQGTGNDQKTTEEICASSGIATDSIIARHRPKAIFPETSINGKEDCERRAEWEARIRAGKSRSIGYEVQGWDQSNGDIWALNSLVRVKDSFLGIDTTLLIAELLFSIDDSMGMTTNMMLVNPGAFEPKPFTEVDEILSKSDTWRTALIAR